MQNWDENKRDNIGPFLEQMEIPDISQAVQSLQSEIQLNVLKRKNLSDSDSPPAKKQGPVA